jgi:hypothetical protein
MGSVQLRHVSKQKEKKVPLAQISFVTVLHSFM